MERYRPKETAVVIISKGEVTISLHPNQIWTVHRKETEGRFTKFTYVLLKYHNILVKFEDYELNHLFRRIENG